MVECIENTQTFHSTKPPRDNVCAIVWCFFIKHSTPRSQYKSDMWPLSVRFPMSSGWLSGALGGGQWSETCWRVYWLALSHRTSVYTFSCWWACSPHPHGSITQRIKKPLFVQLTLWTPYHIIFTCDTFVQLDIMRLCREARPHFSWYTVHQTPNSGWVCVFQHRRTGVNKVSVASYQGVILIMMLVFIFREKVLQHHWWQEVETLHFSVFPFLTFWKRFSKKLAKAKGPRLF